MDLKIVSRAEPSLGCVTHSELYYTWFLCSHSEHTVDRYDCLRGSQFTAKMSKISTIVEERRPQIEPLQQLYKHLHKNPELSNQEKETAATVVDQLSKISSLEIKSNIGGHGVAAVLNNGPGPCVLLRADFDALPVREATGLDYASTKTMKNAEGKEVPVAHACGHDMHTTALIGTAQLLDAALDSWSGTLIFIFQPAEEQGTGAQAMVDDGLYKKHGIPTPDVMFAGHVLPGRTGTIGTRQGLIANSADSMYVRLMGGTAASNTCLPRRYAQDKRRLFRVVSSGFGKHPS